MQSQWSPLDWTRVPPISFKFGHTYTQWRFEIPPPTRCSNIRVLYAGFPVQGLVLACIISARPTEGRLPQRTSESGGLIPEVHDNLNFPSFTMKVLLCLSSARFSANGSVTSVLVLPRNLLLGALNPKTPRNSMDDTSSPGAMSLSRSHYQ